MLVLRQSDILSLLHNLTRPQCIKLLTTLTSTLTSFSTPNTPIRQPLRTTIITSPGQHTSLFMPASSATTSGIKVVTLPSDGSPNSGCIALFTPQGVLQAVMNAEELTAFRTALASMIGFVRRRWSGDGEVVVFGAGKQAEWHVRLAVLLGPKEGRVSKVTVVNRKRESLEKFERNVLVGLGKLYPNVKFQILAKGDEGYEGYLKTFVSEAKAIFGCTPSLEPLFPYGYMMDGRARGKRYIGLIGSYKPHMHEIDTETLLSAELLCVDSAEACLAEAGEIIDAKLGKEQLVEIGSRVEEFEKKGLEDTMLSEGNVVFKCVGMGIMDVGIGQAVVDLAKETKMGINIEGF